MPFAEPDFDDSKWSPAVVIGKPPCEPWFDLESREIPFLRDTETGGAKVIASGETESLHPVEVLDLQKFFLTDHLMTSWQVAYACTCVRSDEPRTIELELITAQALKLWVNGEWIVPGLGQQPHDGGGAAALRVELAGDEAAARPAPLEGHRPIRRRGRQTAARMAVAGDRLRGAAWLGHQRPLRARRRARSAVGARHAVAAGDERQRLRLEGVAAARRHARAGPVRRRQRARRGAVPSDLEQIPSLLNFMEQNGVLSDNHHTPLISHTGTDILTSLTGVYGDDMGVPIANSLRLLHVWRRGGLFFILWLLDRQIDDGERFYLSDVSTQRTKCTGSMGTIYASGM